MRVLVVADEYPWPSRTGYRQRIARVVRVLASRHQVDLFVVLPEDAVVSPPPEGLQGVRVRTVPAGRSQSSPGRRVTRWLASGLPRGPADHDWSAAREVLRTQDRTYDAIWFSHADTFLAFADVLPNGHRVVDIDNLGSQVLAHRRASRGPGAGLTGRVSNLARQAADALDMRRWQRLERAIVDDADVAVVCSDLDRRRLGLAGVRVLPNAYDLAGPPPPRPNRSAGPVLLMVGLLTYPPNRDAAEFFAGQVLGRVRDEFPEATFRLVGRYDTATVASLRGLPGVDLAGEVPDVGDELASADLVVVPVRFGGGTRIKILEAFAYGVPVVSTAVGAEGIEAQDGRHLLLADDPQDFARACLRLLTDRPLAQALAGNARTLWRDCYSPEVIEPQLLALVEPGPAPA